MKINIIFPENIFKYENGIHWKSDGYGSYTSLFLQTSPFLFPFRNILNGNLARFFVGAIAVLQNAHSSKSPSFLCRNNLDLARNNVFFENFFTIRVPKANVKRNIMVWCSRFSLIYCSFWTCDCPLTRVHT